MYENMKSSEMDEIFREKMSYGTPTMARETEIKREYQRLAKAITELSMTCESLEGAFAPVLRPHLEESMLEQDSAKEPSNSTEHGVALQQIRNCVERTTRQVRHLIERKEI